RARPASMYLGRNAPCRSCPLTFDHTPPPASTSSMTSAVAPIAIDTGRRARAASGLRTGADTSAEPLSKPAGEGERAPHPAPGAGRAAGRRDCDPWRAGRCGGGSARVRAAPVGLDRVRDDVDQERVVERLLQERMRA